MRFVCVVLALVAGLCGNRDSVAAEKLTAVEAARQVDLRLAQERPVEQVATPLVDDETFIRRVSLDLVGKPPTPTELTVFAIDPAPEKRARLVERLLARDAYGENWARYWRDVILYRASDPRAAIATQSLQSFLTQQFNSDVSWRETAREFITATGEVRENGATALAMAQEGKAEETTAEVSRIFLGIQIQCAQCHNHPTDRWTRKQFHELAAFFPRMTVRRGRDGDKQTYTVVSVDRRARFGRRGKTSLEHRMPDLNDPTASGELMTPTFFVTEGKLRPGSSDQERRKTLADWITSDSDPWFARAFVNRIWAEMLGEGFYEPIDDLGPDRQCAAPETLDLLAEQFRLHNCEPKWLFATIASTEAYQRQSRPRRLPEGTPFAASCPQPLRGDQLYDALTQALGASSSFTQRGPRSGGGYGRFGPRAAFNKTFGFDPSNPREEVTGSIPQALVMMNSSLVNNAINARAPYSTLARLLSQVKDDKAVISELYLRSLAREPRETEVATCLQHLKEVGVRDEAFEDILWALVNSTEFLYRK